MSYHQLILDKDQERDEYILQLETALKNARKSFYSLEGCGSVIVWENQWELCYNSLTEINRLLKD